MKKTLSSATLFACCGAYSNIIFMGQPLIKALYGEKGLIFCVAVMFVSTLYLFTICSILLSLGTDKMKDSAKVLKDSFLNLVFIFCILSLIITPIIAKAFGGLFLDGMPLAVLVILMGTPAGALLPSFVESYGKSARRASQYVFMSTILSLITLPLVAEFLCRS